MSFRKLAAVLLAGGLALTACGQQSNLGSSAPSAPPVASGASFPEGSTMAKLAAAGTIRVGTKFDQPLFGLKGLDGKPEGFDVEIAKIVSAKLGIPADKIVYTETPSKIREDVIANDQVDMVVATYTINDARKQKISFAGPYYIAGQDLMVKSDNTTITGPETLKAANARVCSVSGSTPAKTITQYVDQANIVLFDVYSKCADALRNGQVEAVTTDNVILAGFAAQPQYQGKLKVVGKPFSEEKYGVGIKKGDTELCGKINAALEKMVSDGAWEKAIADTVGASGFKPDPATNPPKPEPCS